MELPTDQAQDMDDTVRLVLLGGVRILRGATPLPGFHSTKTQALLCYLAVTARPQARSTLATLLWGEMAEERALHSLRQALHNLRRLLPTHLEVNRTHVALNTNEPLWVDAVEFQTALDQAGSRPTAEAIALLRTAVALYSGDFLQGLRVDDAPDFDEWRLLVGEQLHRRALQAFAALIDDATARGDYAAGIGYAERVLALEPWQEDAQRSLMTLLDRNGQAGAALSQYERYARMLRDELGIEPEHATVALAARIRNDAAEPAPSAPSTRHNLPLLPTPLLGRAADIQRILDLLARPDCRLLTLHGPGGVGKTSLGLEVAHRLSTTYRDGVVFVALAPISDPDLVVSAIAQALDVKQSGAQPLLAILQEFIAARHLLLILDNFEQVVAAAPVVAALLAHGSGLKVVVTSRAALRVRGEQIVPVSPLALPTLDATGDPPPDVATLARSPAVALFAQTARAVKPDFVLTPDNARTIARICIRLDGLPLAIELAAARMNLLSPHALLARLSNRLRLLTGGMQDMPARHQTLRDVLAWSYDLLTSDERTVFRRMSVFVGGCTLAAAEAVCDDRTLQTDILACITSLVDKSLLLPMPTTTTPSANGDTPDAEPRITMLETIREFAGERVAATGEDDTLRRTHARVFLAFAQSAEREITGPHQTLWLERLEGEHDNLRAALQWALEQGHRDLLLHLCGSLWRFWYAHSHLTEGRQWLAAALGATNDQRLTTNDQRGRPPTAHHPTPNTYASTPDPRPPTPDPHAKVLHGAGVLAHYQGDNQEARLLLEQALVIRRAEGDAREIATVLHDLAGVVQNQRDGAVQNRADYEQATALYDESLALFRQAGDVAGTALSLYRLGTLAYSQHDDERATALCTESLQLFRALQDKGSMAAALNSLGYLAWRREDYSQALAQFEEGLALYREVRNKQGIAWTLNNLGRVLREQGDVERALTLYEERQTLLETTGHRQSIADGLRLLGQLQCTMGQYRRAIDLLRESLRLCQDLKNTLSIVECLEGLAEVAARQPDHTATALTLWAFAAHTRTDLDAPLSPRDRGQRERDIASTHATLDEAVASTAWAAGHTLTLDGASTLAMTLGTVVRRQ